MMKSRPSPWTKILASSSSSVAVSVASGFNPSDLTETPLPVRPEQLSRCAYDNLVSVCRAHGVRVDGFRNDFWDTWSESEESDEENITNISADLRTSDGSKRPLLNIPISAKPPLKMLSATDNRPLSSGNGFGKEKEEQEELADLIEKQETSPKASDIQKDSGIPSAEDLKHASVLKQWGQSSAHRAPPLASLNHITHSACFGVLLKDIVPSMCAPTFRAAILSALVEDLPSSVAPVVQSQIIVPFLKELKTPAPREMLAAVLSFTSRHSRHTVALYAEFSSNFHTVSNGVIEILSLVVPTIPQQVALDAFKVVTSAFWSDITIPLISSMKTRCQSMPAFLDLLVPALDRNAPNLEKSIRFGKLLFTLVNDLPQIRQSHKQQMELICQQSKVFLAKRALNLLKSEANPQ